MLGRRRPREGGAGGGGGGREVARASPWALWGLGGEGSRGRRPVGAGPQEAAQGPAGGVVAGHSQSGARRAGCAVPALRPGPGAPPGSRQVLGLPLVSEPSDLSGAAWASRHPCPRGVSVGVQCGCSCVRCRAHACAWRAAWRCTGQVCVCEWTAGPQPVSDGPAVGWRLVCGLLGVSVSEGDPEVEPEGPRCLEAGDPVPGAQVSRGAAACGCSAAPAPALRDPLQVGAPGRPCGFCAQGILAAGRHEKCAFFTELRGPGLGVA